MMKIFIDTSAWIAIIASKDPHHAAITAAWRGLLQQGARPVTTSDVITETVTFLRYRAGHGTAVDFRRMINQAVEEGRLDLVWTDAKLFEGAWRIFLKYVDQDLSMVDCTSVALCRREKIGKALTLDGHFRGAGIEIVAGS